METCIRRNKKNASPLSIFKSRIKTWTTDNCTCRFCKTFVKDLLTKFCFIEDIFIKDLFLLETVLLKMVLSPDIVISRSNPVPRFTRFPVTTTLIRLIWKLQEFRGQWLITFFEIQSSNVTETAWLSYPLVSSRLQINNL